MHESLRVHLVFGQWPHFNVLEQDTKMLMNLETMSVENSWKVRAIYFF